MGALGGTCHVRNCVQGVDHLQTHTSQLRYVAIHGKRDDRRSRHLPVALTRSFGTRPNAGSRHQNPGRLLAPINPQSEIRNPKFDSALREQMGTQPGVAMTEGNREFYSLGTSEPSVTQCS